MEQWPPLVGDEGDDAGQDAASGRRILVASPVNCSGAKITISLRMRGKGLVSDDKGSPAVWLEFTNETGRSRQRAYLVGKDEQGQMHNAKFTKGNYDWKKLQDTITAPDVLFAWRSSLACCHARAKCTSTTSTLTPPAKQRAECRTK